MRFKAAGFDFDLGKKTLIMGILNVTPDSFSDGGRYMDPPLALQRALAIQSEGAELLDVGAQSTRPGSVQVSPEQELERLLPVLESLRGKVSIPISVDTYYPLVAAAALDRGAAIINDCSGCTDPAMLRLVADTGCGLIMMFPREARHETESAVDAAAAFFADRLAIAAQLGIPKQSVCIDPGIGFGEQAEESFTLLSMTGRFSAFNVPLLVGASRKRFIATVSDGAGQDALDRLGGTVAAHTVAQWLGAHILRVHDVGQSVQAAMVTDQIKRAGADQK